MKLLLLLFKPAIALIQNKFTQQNVVLVVVVNTCYLDNTLFHLILTTTLQDKQSYYFFNLFYKFKKTEVNSLSDVIHLENVRARARRTSVLTPIIYTNFEMHYATQSPFQLKILKRIYAC